MPDAGFRAGGASSAESPDADRIDPDSDYFLDTHTPLVRRGVIPPPEVSVILPVHNEARAIADVVSEVQREIGSRLSTEIICTEDGSADGTPLILLNLAEKVPLKVLSSRRRKGYAGAIADGVTLVSSKYVLFADSDGQHMMSDFWRLFSARNQASIVSGWRFERADPFVRRGMSLVFASAAKTVFRLPPLHDVTAPFRLVATSVAKRLTKKCKYMRESFWTEFTIQAAAGGYSIIEIPIRHRMRTDGASRVYKLRAMPEIAYRQLVGLAKTWADLRTESRGARNVA